MWSGAGRELRAAEPGWELKGRRNGERTKDGRGCGKGRKKDGEEEGGP